MPDELRERLVAASKLAGRSLNAEIVHRLAESVAEETLPGELERACMG